MNVKAINRSSENFAQYINKKEDERLAKKLTSIDREKTVFNNSITRDEKVPIQQYLPTSFCDHSPILLLANCVTERKVLFQSVERSNNLDFDHEFKSKPIPSFLGIIFTNSNTSSDPATTF